MATFSIGDMSGAMSTVYRKMVGQVQRKAPTFRLLAAIGALNRSNTGLNMTWDVKFSGQQAAAVNVDGGSFLTAASDVPVAASLAFGTYAAPVKVTDDMLWRGSVTGGLPADINPFADPIAINIKDGIEQWVKAVNQDIFAGAGTSNTLTGLYVAVNNSGTYASVNSSTYTGWKSTVDGNSGTLRSLTLALIKKNLRTVAVNSKLGRPDIAICTPAIMDAVEALFEAYTRINYSPSDGMAAPGGAGERVSMNPPVITTAGGRINADGFRVFHWQNQRLWFVEDPDCLYSGITNTTNVMYLLNSGDVELQYIPPPGANMYDTDPKVLQAAEQDMGPIANMQLELTKRGRTQYATELDITGKVGLKLNSRNAHAVLQDVQ